MGVCVIRHGLPTLAVAVALALNPLTPAGAGQTALKVTLDGKIEGPAAPFFVALEQGYFKAQGLDVTIDPSAGLLEPITRVASGAYDIAFGDINALIRYRDQNPAAPIKAVLVVNNRPNYAIVGRKSRGVARVIDLEGKRLGAPAAEPATAAWPILAKIRGVDVSKVTVLNVGLPVREPMLAAGEVDAVTGSSASSPVSLRAKGVPADDIVVLQMAERGLDLYGGSIFVSTKVLAEKPEAVKGFLSAFVRGLKDTLRDPAAAVDAVVRRTGANSREVELERLRAALRDSVATPEAMANGLGGVEAERFDKALDQIGTAYGYKNRPKLADVFDNSFLPPEAERKLD
jgi:NitT/TauT family transport system substrate-binding protein